MPNSTVPDGGEANHACMQASKPALFLAQLFNFVFSPPFERSWLVVTLLLDQYFTVRKLKLFSGQRGLWGNQAGEAPGAEASHGKKHHGPWVGVGKV